MRVLKEHRFIDLLQKRPHHFLNKLVFHGRYAKRPFLAVGFRDVDPTYRHWFIGSLRKPPNDGSDLIRREAVKGFAIHTRRHRTFIRCTLLISLLPEERALHQTEETINLPTRLN